MVSMGTYVHVYGKADVVDTHTLQSHVAGNLKDDNTHEHELVPQVYCALLDVHVYCKAAGQGAG